MGVAAGVIGGIAGLAGAGAQIYGASQAGATAGFYPERDASHWTQAFVQQAPTLFGLEQLYQPAYAGLGMRTAEQTIFGQGPQTQKHRVLRYDRKKNRHYWVDQNVNLPGQRGLLDIAERAQPRMERMYYDAQRRHQGFTAEGMGRSMGLARALDPQGMGLGDDLAVRAREGLELGGALDASTRREVQQSIRAGQADRGMGLGPADLYQEAMEMGSAAEARRREREGFALGVNAGRPNMGMVAMDRIMSPAPTAGLGLSMAGTGVATSGATGPRLGFDPWRSPGLMPANNAMPNAMAAAGGGLMGLGGQMIGHYMNNRGPQPVAGPGGQTYYPQQGNGGTYYS